MLLFLYLQDTNYGSTWMVSDSPEMAVLTCRRNRRRSHQLLDLPVLFIDGEDEADDVNIVSTDMNTSDDRMSMEMFRNGDQSPVRNTASSRLTGECISPELEVESSLVDTSGRSAQGRLDSCLHNEKLNLSDRSFDGSSSLVNSFSEHFQSDISNNSLSPCFEAHDYNVGKSAEFNDSSIHQNQASVSPSFVLTSSLEMNCINNLVATSIVEGYTVGNVTNATGTPMNFTSCMTPKKNSGETSSCLLSDMTPYSPSQPVFQNITPYSCESPNSTLSPIYLTPSEKVTRTKLDCDAISDDEDVWKTCTKTIPVSCGQIQTSAGVRNIKHLKSTQKKSIRKDKRKSGIPEIPKPTKQQTTGFLSICRSLAGKLANAVRKSPNPEHVNQTPEDSIAHLAMDNDHMNPVLCSMDDNLNDTYVAVVEKLKPPGDESGQILSQNLLVKQIGDCDNCNDADEHMEFSSQLTIRKHANMNSGQTEEFPEVKADDQGLVEMCTSEVSSDVFSCRNFFASSSSHSGSETTAAAVGQSDSADGEEIQDLSGHSRNDRLICHPSYNETSHVRTCIESGVSGSWRQGVVNVSSECSETIVNDKVGDALKSEEPNICVDIDLAPNTGTMAACDGGKSIKAAPKRKRPGRKSMGLIVPDVTKCELSESVNNLTLNPISEMENSKERICAVKPLDKGAIKDRTDAEKCEKADGLLTASGKPVKKRGRIPSKSNSCEMNTDDVGETAVPIVFDSNAAVNNALVVSQSQLFQTVSEVKNRGRPRRSIIAPVIMEGHSSLRNPSENTLEPVSTTLPSRKLCAVKKRGNPAKINRSVLPALEEKLAFQNSSAKRDVQWESVSSSQMTAFVENELAVFSSTSVSVPNEKNSENSERNIPGSSKDSNTFEQGKSVGCDDDMLDRTGSGSDVLASEQNNSSGVKMLTDKELKELDEYLGIEDIEVVAAPPPKKKGRSRSRKSVDGSTNLQTIQIDDVQAQTESPLASLAENLTMDLDPLVKDSLVAELADLELIERPTRRRSTRIKRKSIEIYKQSRIMNLVDEDEPMSPLEIGGESTAEKSGQHTGNVLQDVNGDVGRNKDPVMKQQRKRKITKAEQSLEDLYKNKNFKRPTPKIWETIYEAPAQEQVFSKKRYRRSIAFENCAIVPPAKTKLRLRKAIKNGLDPRQRRRKMLSDAIVIKTLATMDAVLEEK